MLYVRQLISRAVWRGQNTFRLGMPGRSKTKRFKSSSAFTLLQRLVDTTASLLVPFEPDIRTDVLLLFLLVLLLNKLYLSLQRISKEIHSIQISLPFVLYIQEWLPFL